MFRLYIVFSYICIKSISQFHFSQHHIGHIHVRSTLALISSQVITVYLNILLRMRRSVILVRDGRTRLFLEGCRRDANWAMWWGGQGQITSHFCKYKRLTLRGRKFPRRWEVEEGGLEEGGGVWVESVSCALVTHLSQYQMNFNLKRLLYGLNCWYFYVAVLVLLVVDRGTVTGWVSQSFELA